MSTSRALPINAVPINAVPINAVPISTVGNAGPLKPITYPAVATPEQAQLRADAMQRGHQRGHTLGYAAGLQRAREEAALRRAGMDAEHGALLARLTADTNAEIAALVAAGAALAARTKPVLDEAEQTLFACALSLAEAVLGRELGDGSASAQAILARVLARQDETGAPLVRVNPQDLDAIRAESLAASGLKTVADPAMARGEAVAEYPEGFLDARISTALDRARRALLETPA